MTGKKRKHTPVQLGMRASKRSKSNIAVATIHRYCAVWWAAKLQNNACSPGDDTPSGVTWLRRGNRVLVCPITLMPISKQKAFYVQRVFYDANAIAAHCLKNGFTDPVRRGAVFTSKDVQRMSAKIKKKSRKKLLQAYQNRENIKRVRDEENHLLSNYHAILDHIFAQIKRYSTLLMLNTRVRYNPRNVEASVAIDEGWMPLWVTILQYRGVHEQLCELNESVGQTTQRHHQQILLCLHQQLPAVYRGPCPKAYRQSCEVLCSFFATSLATLHSTNIIQVRANLIRNSNRTRFRTHTNVA